MTTFNEDFHAGSAIASEAPGTLSRDVVTILDGQTIKANHVLGKTLTGGAATSAAKGTNVGNGVMGAITVTGAAKLGVYVLTIIEPASNAGTYIVQDPDGVSIGHGNVAAAFSAGGLAFTLADGATDFVSGDEFGLTVTGAYKYKEYNPGNSDGSQVACAVAFAPVDASAADAEGVVLARQVELITDALVWFSGATGDQITAGLAQLATKSLIGR